MGYISLEPFRFIFTFRRTLKPLQYQIHDLYLTTLLNHRVEGKGDGKEEALLCTRKGSKHC